VVIRKTLVGRVVDWRLVVDWRWVVDWRQVVDWRRVVDQRRVVDLRQDIYRRLVVGWRVVGLIYVSSESGGKKITSTETPWIGTGTGRTRLAGWNILDRCVSLRRRPVRLARSALPVIYIR
jgi:hypothetical protein